MGYIECRCDIYICKKNRIVNKDYNITFRRMKHEKRKGTVQIGEQISRDSRLHDIIGNIRFNVSN